MSCRRDAFRHVLEEDDFRPFLPSRPAEQMAAVKSLVAAELDLLSQKRLFSRYDVASSPEELDVAEILQIIKSCAPTWADLMGHLLQNRWAHWQSYRGEAIDGEGGRMDGLMERMTAMVCHARMPRRSNELARSLAIYLVASRRE